MTMNYKNSTIVLAVVLVAGVGISFLFPAFGEEYEYETTDEHETQYSKSSTPNQIANCDNTIVVINSVDQKQTQRQNQEQTVGAEALSNLESPLAKAVNALTGDGGSGIDPLLRIDKNIVNVCVNQNTIEDSLQATGNPNQGDFEDNTQTQN